MPQITGPLVLKDGSNANRTFSPEKITPGDSIFSERTAPASAGFIRLKTGLNPASARRATNHVIVDLDYPVLQTVDGVSRVAFTARFQGKFVIPDVATAADRANVISFVREALTNEVIAAQVKDLDPLY